MKTAVVNIKTDPIIKTRAKKVAEKLGFSLSALLNAYMKTLIRTREVHFSIDPREEPSEYFIESLKEAKRDVEADRVSPAFDNAEDATAWLKKEVKKYAS